MCYGIWYGEATKVYILSEYMMFKVHTREDNLYITIVAAMGTSTKINDIV